MLEGLTAVKQQTNKKTDVTNSIDEKILLLKVPINIGQYREKYSICASQRKTTTIFGYLRYNLLFR